MAAMFFGVNMLNNWAFAFNISVPVHIILRSFGSVTTMAAGWVRGKKYSALQIFSVGVLTLGVGVSAWADAVSKVGSSTSPLHLVLLEPTHSAISMLNHHRAKISRQSKRPARRTSHVASRFFCWLRSSPLTWASMCKTLTPNTAPTGGKTSSTPTSSLSHSSCRFPQYCRDNTRDSPPPPL